eukprot:GHUV01027287.1.p1 GENE.GHUV01027287.1~~GHUV01027287.1.p1  ORF type:complete len:272 (+),score=55.46 GHUV01027287.1:417-1232(+)
MLLSSGMLLQPAMPQMRQVSDSTVVVAARVAFALFITANALVLVPAANQPIGRLSILAAAVILLSPISSASMEFARNFRLSEPLMQTCKDMSLFLAGPLLVLFSLAVGALRVLPLGLPGPAQRLEIESLTETAVAADPGGATMLAALMLLTAAAVTIAAGFIQDRYSMDKKVPLKYIASSSATAVDPRSSSSALGGQSSSGKPPNPGTAEAACGGSSLARLGGCSGVVVHHRAVFAPSRILSRQRCKLRHVPCVVGVQRHIASVSWAALIG